MVLFPAVALAAPCPAGDADGDGVCDDVDDCPSIADPSQGAPFDPPVFVSLTVGGLLAIDTRVGVADVDGDGLDDALIAGLVEVEWAAGTGAGFALDATVAAATSVVSVGGADLDGDGDDDVLVGSAEAGAGTWWAESLGGGAFGPRRILDAAARGPAAAGDLDGDGDLDVVYSSDDYVAWRENLGGGSFTGPRRDVVAWVASPSAPVPAVAVADLDGDGDGDVLGGSPYPAWYDHQGGGNFFQRALVGTEAPAAWEVEDLDGDGDLDAAAIVDAAARVYPNLGGSLAIPADVLAPDAVLTSVVAADVDQDGLVDLVAAGPVGTEPGVWLARNAGGLAFAAPERLDPDDGFASVAVADADQDGFHDLVVGRRTDQPPYPPFGDVRWYHNALPFPVDTDGDGLCDPDDPCLDPPVDADGDGVCAQAGDGSALDCDDGDASRFPGAPELCDGRDNACDGTVPPDEADGDGDGARLCDLDCDDADPASFPGATEACNGIDDDCNGIVDPGCASTPTTPGQVLPPAEEKGGCGCRSGGGSGCLLVVAGVLARRRSRFLGRHGGRRDGGS